MGLSWILPSVLSAGIAFGGSFSAGAAQAEKIAGINNGMWNERSEFVQNIGKISKDIYEENEPEGIVNDSPSEVVESSPSPDENEELDVDESEDLSDDQGEDETIDEDESISQ